MDATLSYSFDDYDSSRQTRFSPYPVADSDYKGNTYALSGTVGYTPVSGSFAMGPVVSLRYAKSRILGFSEENAGPLSVTWDDIRTDSLVGSIGGQISGVGTSVIPQVSLAYEYEFLGDRTITGEFQNGEPIYNDPTTGTRGHLAVGLNLVTETMDNVSVAVGYKGRFANNDRKDHSLSAHMKIGF